MLAYFSYKKQTKAYMNHPTDLTHNPSCWIFLQKP